MSKFSSHTWPHHKKDFTVRKNRSFGLKTHSWTRQKIYISKLLVLILLGISMRIHLTFISRAANNVFSHNSRCSLHGKLAWLYSLIHLHAHLPTTNLFWIIFIPAVNFHYTGTQCWTKGWSIYQDDNRVPWFSCHNLEPMNLSTR